jgi:hypothetical protein
MGECKTISINDLLEGNERVCLSSLRAFNKCELCPVYAKCESKKINLDFKAQLDEKNKLKEELKALKEKIKRL